MPEGWTAEEEAELLALLEYEESLPRFGEFIPQISPRHPPPLHLSPLLEVWERTRYEPVRAVIEMPPRHAKSTTAFHGLAWRLSCDPALNHAYASYGLDLSNRASRITRRLARAAGVTLAADAKNVSEWQTEDGGAFFSTSVGGAITGKGITGVAVCDDLLKGRQAAESKTIRETAWEFLTDDIYTRLEDDASLILIGTRWHEDDPIGRVLSGKLGPDAPAFERIRLPAFAEEGDPLGRKLGDPLWPERFPAAKLREIKSVMGDYSFASLYQQAPRPRGDRLFKLTPARFRLEDWRARLEGGTGFRMLIACDPAATEKRSADHSVILVLAAEGTWSNQRVWIVDHYRDQISIPKLVRALQHFRSKWFGIPIAVEAHGVSKGVPDMLREIDPHLPLIPIVPLGDKFTRAQPVAAAWNEGRVAVPLEVPWANELITELHAFTGVSDAEDDQVDALAHGWNHLLAAGISRRKGEAAAPWLPYG